MSGLLFPKGSSKKRKQIHARSSILQADTDRRRCWLCMRLNGDYAEHMPGALHKHHIYEGRGLRRISEAEGFYVWLCPQHHEFGQVSAHRDIETRRSLQRAAQEVYERKHTREEFLQLIGRSYL